MAYAVGAEVISSSLAEIINVSISTEVYPTKLKMAKIIPIIKAEITLTQTNLISLLFNFNRILERFAFIRMESFIEQNNLLPPSQNGFHKAHLTPHAKQFPIL